MPPKEKTSASDDVKFLLTVIKQLTVAVDWQKVTDELSLPSKGAAAKRFSRLPGKYEITLEKASSSTLDADVPTTPKKGKKTGATKVTSSSKKRKISEEADAEDETGDRVKAEESE